MKKNPAIYSLENTVTNIFQDCRFSTHHLIVFTTSSTLSWLDGGPTLVFWVPLRCPRDPSAPSLSQAGVACGYCCSAMAAVSPQYQALTSEEIKNDDERKGTQHASVKTLHQARWKPSEWRCSSYSCRSSSSSSSDQAEPFASLAHFQHKSSKIYIAHLYVSILHWW